MVDHRKPPKPPHYDIAPIGFCRVCGKVIMNKKGLPSKRARWHKDCLTAYKIETRPGDARKAVYLRDRGICCDCGTACGRKNWDLDHDVPLIENHSDISAWQLPNLKTRCKPCHKKKTALEATARAFKRAYLKSAKSTD